MSKSEGTGFSLRIDITRLALYIALGVLGWLGQAPLWALPALLLYDNSWIMLYHSPKRMKALREWQRMQSLVYAQQLPVVMPGTEVDQ
jgi:hypothetical protein